MKTGPVLALCVALLTTIAAQPRVSAQEASALAARLKDGGYVLLMRHASSPRETPTTASAQPDNTTLERQLDAEGRRGATRMGQSLKRLQIRFDAVRSSPTYRARETMTFMGFPEPAIDVQLGDNGQSMQGVTEAQAAWLRALVAEPLRGGCLLIVTHSPNLTKAFPEWGASVADGETVILRPDGRGHAEVVGRITIDQWP